MSRLYYYVYRENGNNHKIEKYNVLNESIINEIKERTKSILDKEQFADQVANILRYYFWCRAEHEIVITDWPTHIETDEVFRLADTIEDHKNTYSTLPYAVTPKLKTAEKISVYDQVMLNWDIFIDYVWENIK